MARLDGQFSTRLPRNVVIAGETGAGKSSFINLITDSETAAAANDVRGVTTRINYYPWETATHAFRLWDTPGLAEGSSGNVSPGAAERALRSLLRELTKKGGVHLLIMCICGVGKRVTSGMKQTYQVILRIRDKECPQTPVVAVITGVEQLAVESAIRSSLEGWWTQNKHILMDFNMEFRGHACLTTLADDCHPRMPGRRAECQTLARDLVTDCSLPPDAFGEPSRVANVVVVGEVGVGKSSIINMVTGANSATVGSDARAVTVGTSYHDWKHLETQTFRLWDTPGLGERPIGSAPPKRAYTALRSLLTELGRDVGVHLIVVCFRGRRITKAIKEAYDTIFALRNRVCPDAPLVAVITNLEYNCRALDILASMDQWWHVNVDALSEHNMAFAGHACLTTLSDDEHPSVLGRRDACQHLIRDLIASHALTPRSTPTQDLHVVLFGETGVGKSSLVNLLTGWNAAEVSPNTVVYTFGTTEYQFQLGPAIRLWDTAGLREPEDGMDEYLNAVEKAAGLTWRLSTSGGISLFLFCIRGDREMTTTTLSNYRLFWEVLGRKQVPIALVITHLEEEKTMEDWWSRNLRELEKSGMHVSGHVCVTTLEGHPKCVESRNALQDLLWQYTDQGKFSMLMEMWLSRLLNGLQALLGIGLPRGKDLTRILAKQCQLEPDMAQKLAIRIESIMDMHA